MSSHIWRLQLGPIGENCYIATSLNTTVIIDPGAEPERIITFLKEYALVPSLIVLTHGHLDHCAAIPEILEAIGSDIGIAIHPDDAHFLGEASKETNRRLFEAIRAPSYFAAFWKPLPAPTVFLEDGMMVPGTTLQVIHTPGHSRGSICLHESALQRGSYGTDDAEHGQHGTISCLISGDTLFRDGVGRTDTPDSDPVELERSLRKLAHFVPETLVFPGHGPRTTIGRELPPPLKAGR
ncbi:MAG: MBL fold metallo-hydrolase [Rectinema sp.]|nr:MBL fold metallo-hydrolase [Rectinema sp.]